MKKLMTVMICLTMVVFTYGQKAGTEIPAAAKSAFSAKFPTAKKVKWSVEKPGEFEVDFTLNNVEQSALVDPKGNIIETEIEIKESELPQAVKAALAKDFAGYKKDEFTKVTDAKGVVAFEMQVIKGKEKLAVEFDANGKLLSKTALKEEKEGKEDKN
ncbi:MAG: PepSY-like domain-containing protein [Prolixibacteraceae bacterium]